MTDADIARAFTFPEGLDAIDRREQARSGVMAAWSPFGDDDAARARALRKQLGSADLGDERDRAIGAVLGLAIGDALGAPLEFRPVRYGITELTGFDGAMWVKDGYNRFGLQPGQWTDDTSMAMCLADSLLLRNGFDARDLRLRFLNWWHFGYCNAFGFDAERPTRTSVGLGGNVGQSFDEFMAHRTEFTTAGDRRTSGNGSLMRNAPIAIFYREDPELAEAMSCQQSRTTHQGDEAAECCRLLTRSLLRALHGDGTPRFLDTLGDRFTSSAYAVGCLARSEQEARHDDNAGQALDDRDWNWRRPDFRYSPTRASEHPDYVGSYAMDALAMALHCVWSTRSFADAVLRCANLGGDADTTAAITGQLAGAIYGAKGIPGEWLAAVDRWDPRSSLLLRADLLFHGAGRRGTPVPRGTATP